MLSWGGTPCVIANLGQNPQRRPIVGRYLPTLLKNSFMWKINKDETNVNSERQMVGKDCVISVSTVAVFMFHQFHFEFTAL